MTPPVAFASGSGMYAGGRGLAGGESEKGGGSGGDGRRRQSHAGRDEFDDQAREYGSLGADLDEFIDEYHSQVQGR